MLRKAMSVLQLTPKVGQGIIHAQVWSPLDHVISIFPVMSKCLCIVRCECPPLFSQWNAER